MLVIKGKGEGIMDNYQKWLAHDNEIETVLTKRPVCDECGEHIQDEYCYEINGDIICPECMKDNHRKWTEDIIS